MCQSTASSGPSPRHIRVLETPQPPDEEDRPAPSPEAGGAEPEALDITEWVSELRRLYVEPKTRAEVHQESAIAPLKRKLRLRGPRRTPLPVDVEAGPIDESPPEPVETAAPDSVEPPAPAHEPVTWDLKVDPASVPAPVVPAVDHAPPPPPAVAVPDPLDASEPVEHQPAAAWLFSYLEATGHGTDAGVSPATTPSAATAAEAASPDETSSTAMSGDPADTLVSERLPGDVEAPVVGEQADGEEPKAPKRSLADLAGGSAAATAAYSVARAESPVDADTAYEVWSTTELGTDSMDRATLEMATNETDVDLDAPHTVADWAEPEDTVGVEPAEDAAEPGLVSEPGPQQSRDLPERATGEEEAEPAAEVVWSEPDPVLDELRTVDPPEAEVAFEPDVVPEQDWAEPESTDEMESEPAAAELDHDLAASDPVVEATGDRGEPEPEPVLEPELEDHPATDRAGELEEEQAWGEAEPESAGWIEPDDDEAAGASAVVTADDQSEPEPEPWLEPELQADEVSPEPVDDLAEPELILASELDRADDVVDPQPADEPEHAAVEVLPASELEQAGPQEQAESVGLAAEDMGEGQEGAEPEPETDTEPTAEVDLLPAADPARAGGGPGARARGRVGRARARAD